MENIQEKFFSKNNISLLNNKILENINVKSLNEKQRIHIAQTIVNNMKIIWKTIDISKIRPDNFQSVLNQFNNIVFKNSFNEINKENLIVNPINKKYERDFNSNPNNGVIVNERPKFVKNNSHIGPNEEYIMKSQERHILASQPDDNFNNLFRPIIDKVSDEPQFNNYSSDRSNDFKEKLQDIQRIRDTEVPINRKDADLPNFLKPKSTSVRSREDFTEKPIKMQETKVQRQELNFIDGADDNENLYSLDNIDKSLIDDNNYIEDQSSFTDRLNRLKNDRSNIEIPKQRTIDFKSDNFEDDFNDIQPTRIDKIKNNDFIEIQPTRIDKIKNNEIDIQPIKKNKITSEHKKIFDKLKELNLNLMSQLTTCKEENKQLRHDNLELAEKLQEIIYKEKEINEKYDNMINTKTFQLEINPDSSISSYRYNFINTMNVSGIKLTSCSIPFKKYNIENDINNIFLYTVNNIEQKIILSEGFYTIDDIIKNLNSNQNDIIFNLNLNTQKIKISSEIKFNIIPSTLSIIYLGFKSNCNNNDNYIADTIYDLRINNKVYLYFTNISDTPISIITPNTNIYDSELLFENSVKLNYLDIAFKDENDNNYNFYNISHTIHLNLITNE